MPSRRATGCSPRSPPTASSSRSTPTGAACARCGRRPRRARSPRSTWSPDGNKLALIAGGKLVVWDCRERDLEVAAHRGRLRSRRGRATARRSASGAGSRRRRVVACRPRDGPAHVARARRCSRETFAWAPEPDRVALHGRPAVVLVGDAARARRGAVGHTGVVGGQQGARVRLRRSRRCRTRQGSTCARRSATTPPPASSPPPPVSSPRWSPDGPVAALPRRQRVADRAGDGRHARPRCPGSPDVTLADWQPCDRRRHAVLRVGRAAGLHAPRERDDAGRPAGRRSRAVHGPREPRVCRSSSRGRRSTGRSPASATRPPPASSARTRSPTGSATASATSEVVTVKIFVVPRPAAVGAADPDADARGHRARRS